MAASLVGEAVVEAVFGELLKAVLELKDKAIMFKQTLIYLQSTLVAIAPVIKEIEQYNNDLGRPKEELESLIREMEEGTKLIFKCSKIHRLNYVARIRYQEQLVGLVNSLVKFCIIDMQAQTARDQKETLLKVTRILSKVNKIPLLNTEDTTMASSSELSEILDSSVMHPNENSVEEAMEQSNQVTRSSTSELTAIQPEVDSTKHVMELEHVACFMKKAGQVRNHIYDGKKNENDIELEQRMITKSLMDFSATKEHDDASVWSMQVNASTHGECYEDDNMEEIAENDELDYIDISSCDDEEEGDVEYGGLLLDQLCEWGEQQMVRNHIYDGKKNENDIELEQRMITKSLMDFSATKEHDDASVWSMQVNASTHGECYEDDNMEEIAENDELDYIDISSCDDEEEGDVEYGGLLLDQLCEWGEQQMVKVKFNPSPCINHVSNSEDNILHSVDVSDSESFYSTVTQLSRTNSFEQFMNDTCRLMLENEESQNHAKIGNNQAMEHLMREKFYAKLVSYIQLPKIIRINSHGIKKVVLKPSHEIFVAFKGCPDFDPRNILGASVEVCERINYGITYKATMEDGKIMLVNKLKDVMLGKKELKELVDYSQRIPQHSNVTPLLAYYYCKGDMLQIYDNMNGNSISRLLHGIIGSEGTHLDWDSRLKISLGVARGIAHIHYHSAKRRKIVHGNITSSNVLVGLDLQSCILHPLLTPEANLSKNKGYQAPEVIKTGKMTQKSDVYSFGILLFEMLTGKSPLEYDDLPGYLEHKYLLDRMDGLPFYRFFDAGIGHDMSGKGYSMMTLANDCVARVPKSRPLMDDVVTRIEDIVASN